MSWNTISTSDVLEEFTPQESDALQAIQGVSNALDGILTKVVAKVRGQIKAGGNPLETTSGTIPDQLALEAIAIARWRWLSSFPALARFKSKDRQKAAEDAEALLLEISSAKPGRPRVELPANPDTTAAPVGATVIAREGTTIQDFGKLGST